MAQRHPPRFPDHFLEAADVAGMDRVRAPLQPQPPRHLHARGHHQRLDRRPLARDPSRGRARRGVAGHHPDPERLRDLRRALAQRVGGGRLGRGFGEVNPRRVDRVVLDAPRDPVHHRHRLDRKSARGAFGRQHHRIRAVVDRGRDVADLGARRGRADDHRFEHLRRHHHRLARLPRQRDDPVLHRRDTLGGKLDAKVAARDHQRVGERQYLVQPLDRHRLLDLGEQRRFVPDQRARLGDILGPLDERQRNIIRPLLERELEVASVLGGQRRDRDQHVGNIDPLVVAELAPDLDPRLDPLGGHADHLEPDLAIVDQQRRAGLDRLEQFGVRKLDPGRVAERGIAIERETVPGRDRCRPAVEIADPELGALQVEQDRRRPPELLLERADRHHQRGLVGLVAVAHVDPEGVGPGTHQRLDHRRLGRRRAKRRQHLHLASARRHRRNDCHDLPLVAGRCHSR